MTKIYLAARYGRRHEMLEAAKVLEDMGHTVTSRWIRGEHELDDHLLNTDPDFRNREGARFATDDLEDLLAAEVFVAFSEEPGEKMGRGRGGRHFEAGVAYICAKYGAEYVGGPSRLVLIGHKENVFLCLPDWEHYPNFGSFVAQLVMEATR